MIRCVFLLTIALLALACTSKDDAPSPTATRPPTATSAAAVVSATIAASPTPLPGDPPKTFWLLDAATGDVTTLIEDYDEDDWLAGFNDAGDRAALWSYGTNRQLVFDLDANQLSGTAAPQRVPVCESRAPEVIDGQEHLVETCISTAGLPIGPSPGEPVQYDSPLSPDGVWDLYQINTGLPTQTPNSGGSYALWALNVRTGERWQLHDELYSCGGCDGPSGSAWSPSGRYFVHIERGPQHRATLIDFAASEVHDITWPSEFGTSARWSPVADVLVRTAGPDAMAITDFETGVEHIVPGIHPRAEFDATGRYLYADSGSGRDEMLSVADVATGKVVQVFPGAPQLIGAELFGYPRPVVATSQGFVAVLGDVEGCEGTSVQRDAVQLACIEGGDYPALSPNGARVVMTRETSNSDPLRRSSRYHEYEIVLYDIATKAETVIAEGARGNDAPILKWNAASTHVLMEWPAYRGP